MGERTQILGRVLERGREALQYVSSYAERLRIAIVKPIAFERLSIELTAASLLTGMMFSQGSNTTPIEIRAIIVPATAVLAVATLELQRNLSNSN